MRNNFWEKLSKPIYALAPMAGVTDSAFRQICKSFGADVVYSEMASVNALTYAPKKTLEMLEFTKIERPYVVQLFGSDPSHFAQATKLITKKLKPSGIDINFGCPVKKVQKQGAGAILMNDLKLSKEIIKSVIGNTNLPVSIKTRIKAGKVDILKFLDNVGDLDFKALMIHGRTLSQGFTGDIDWKKVKKAREYFKGIILANGGVGLAPTPGPSPARSSRERRGLDYTEWLLEKTGADGVGIARGAMGSPWIFRDFKSKKFKTRSQDEIFKIALKHAKLSYKLKGKIGIREMRKHLCWYVGGLPNARSLRNKIVQVNSIEDIKSVLK